jgi:hypothetical protein
MDGQQHDRKEARTGNTGLAKVAVQCSADTFVVNQTLVLRVNICGENRHLRQARKRCTKASLRSPFVQRAAAAPLLHKVLPPVALRTTAVLRNSKK